MRSCFFIVSLILFSASQSCTSDSQKIVEENHNTSDSTKETLNKSDTIRPHQTQNENLIRITENDLFREEWYLSYCTEYYYFRKTHEFWNIAAEALWRLSGDTISIFSLGAGLDKVSMTDSETQLYRIVSFTSSELVMYPMLQNHKGWFCEWKANKLDTIRLLREQEIEMVTVEGVAGKWATEEFGEFELKTDGTLETSDSCSGTWKLEGRKLFFSLEDNEACYFEYGKAYDIQGLFNVKLIAKSLTSGKEDIYWLRQ